jgi:DNA-binding transcriptional LysR family regulator
MSAIDLNLLRVFDALLEEQSVTRAGSRLGLTQSAVSHALTRLRHAFGDPLFVRAPSGMQPTPRALEVGPGVHAALAQLQTAMQPSEFDPATAERRFTLAAGAYGCAILLPELVARLAEQAPGVELVVVQPALDVVEQLDLRRADFAFWVADNTPERVKYKPLLTETMVWAVRAGHPALTSGLDTLEMLASLTHVVIPPRRPMTDLRGSVSEATWEGLRPFTDALAARGLTQKIGVTVPDIYSAITVVARSDMAALIPRRLGLISQRVGLLKLIEPPHANVEIEMSLLILKERLNEPAVAWMAKQLIEVGRLA